MNILAIGAHPDDIEYGCGGALAKYSRLGHQVYLLIMTKGEIGAGGKGTLRAGSTLSILRKQPTGSWVVVRDANLLPPVR